MKKSITAIALAASSTSAFAMIEPNDGAERKTYCVSTYEADDGSQYVSQCDETENNKRENRPLLQNGCAEGQAAIGGVKRRSEKKFDIEISACLPPNVVQL
jgi:hypothetical protein